MKQITYNIPRTLWDDSVGTEYSKKIDDIFRSLNASLQKLQTQTEESVAVLSNRFVYVSNQQNIEKLKH